MKRKIFRILLLLFIFYITGCGKNVRVQENMDNQRGIEEDKGDQKDTASSMGRYIETAYSLPEGLGYKRELIRLSDGSLTLFDNYGNYYVSLDGGETWNQGEVPWFNQFATEEYIESLSGGEDGSIGLVYGVKEEEGMEFLGVIFDKEGKRTDINGMEGKTANNFHFSHEGGIFLTDSQGGFYEINKETGDTKLLFEGDTIIYYGAIVGNVFVGISQDSVYCFDLERGQLLEEDKTLSKFIQDDINKSLGNNADTKTLLLIPGEEEDVLYLACDKGLYRHVLNGTVMEQVIEGSLSTFGDPSCNLYAMCITKDNTFFVLFSQKEEIVRFAYDETVPTVPDKQLKIFSLKENQMIRRTISQYQKENPQVYIQYSIGLDGQDGMREEDAIKNLNTEILSGKGPDIIILDGMNIESYRNRGVLEDLSPLLEEISASWTMFLPIINAYKTGETVEAVPARFSIPIMIGPMENISKIDSLQSLAEEMEEIRKKEKDGTICSFYSEEMALRYLTLLCSNEWKKEDNTLHVENIRNFLTLAKRIYDADILGVDELEIQKRKEQLDSSGGMKMDRDIYIESRLSILNGALNIAEGDSRLSIGSLDALYRFPYLTSAVSAQKGYGWKGENTNEFLAHTVIGMNSQSSQKELGKDFIRKIFSEEVQSGTGGDRAEGLPVNKEAFLKQIKEYEPGKEISSIGYTNKETGEMFSFTITAPENIERDNLVKLVEELTKVKSGDKTIENIIYEIGSRALFGEITVDEAVEEIEKKASIYLAE